MSAYDPNRERRERFARRESSVVPLSDVERAERRHYMIQTYWGYLYIFTPAIAWLLLGLLFFWILPFAVVAAIGFWAAIFVSGIVFNTVNKHVRSAQGLWLKTHAWCHALVGAGWAFVIIASGAFAANGIGGGPFYAVVIGLSMAAWPPIYARVRARYPSDYERYLAGAQTPQRGFIE